MITFPNAKINIGLNVLRKREDGYHDIDSCLYPIPWHDVLEIVKSDDFEFTQTGLTVDGDPKNNLCVRAYEMLKEQHGIGSVKMHLHKIIPMGAGLGGGSSDAAFTIKILNQLFELGLSAAQMKSYAGQLGSDCPFFIDNIPALATGTGTDLRPIGLELADLHIAVVYPGTHIGTAEAYGGVTPAMPNRALNELLSKPIAEWKQSIQNDFEASVFPNHPEIEKIKTELYQQGAIYAAMSGSGSAVFGLFDKAPTLDFEDKLMISAPLSIA